MDVEMQKESVLADMLTDVEEVEVSVENGNGCGLRSLLKLC